MAAKAGLHKADIIATAGELADAVGLESVTLAALAERLSVRTPTLYHYFAGTAGLRHELALAGLQQETELLGKAVMGKSGAEAMRAIADALRAYIKNHPGLYAATVTAVGADADVRTEMAGPVDIALRALSAYHLPPDDAIHAVRMLRSIVHGLATLEIAGGFGLPYDVDETFRRLIDAYLRALEVKR